MNSEKLKNCRTERGLSLSEVGSMYYDKYGEKLNKGTLCHYENGNHEPLPSTIDKLAKLYNVPVEYLLGEEEDYKDKRKAYTDMTKEEIRLCLLYRNASPEIKEKVKEMLAFNTAD